MKNKSFQNPTSRDVARLAGVSQPAVSRAFTPGSSLSVGKRERILAAAAELGYRPNILARSLNTGSSKIVGIVLGQFENPFFSQAIDHFSREFERQGLRVLLFRAETNATVDAQVAELLSYQVRAVILLAVNLSSKIAAECTRLNIPVVLFNRTARDAPGSYAVVGSNREGAAEVARHLVRSGRRRFSFMAGYEDSSTSQEREIGFVEAIVAAGFDTPRRVVGGYSREGAAIATRELFNDEMARPDALFCANDLMAISAIETLREDFGFEAGRECAVAGFDDIAMSSWPSFSLTTYSQPIEAMVLKAVEHVVQGGMPATTAVLAGELITRRSA